MENSDSGSISSIGFLLIVFGFALAFVAMIFLAVRTSRSPGTGRSAGLIMIGPIPIIFGSDRQSVKWLMILAIVLIALVLTVMLVPLIIGR